MKTAKVHPDLEALFNPFPEFNSWTDPEKTIWLQKEWLRKKEQKELKQLRKRNQLRKDLEKMNKQILEKKKIERAVEVEQILEKSFNLAKLNATLDTVVFKFSKAEDARIEDSEIKAFFEREQWADVIKINRFVTGVDERIAEVKFKPREEEEEFEMLEEKPPEGVPGKEEVEEDAKELISVETYDKTLAQIKHHFSNGHEEGSCQIIYDSLKFIGNVRDMLDNLKRMLETDLRREGDGSWPNAEVTVEVIDRLEGLLSVRVKRGEEEHASVVDLVKFTKGEAFKSRGVGTFLLPRLWSLGMFEKTLEEDLPPGVKFKVWLADSTTFRVRVWRDLVQEKLDKKTSYLGLIEIARELGDKEVVCCSIPRNRTREELTNELGKDLPPGTKFRITEEDVCFRVHIWRGVVDPEKTGAPSLEKIQETIKGLKVGGEVPKYVWNKVDLEKLPGWKKESEFTNKDVYDLVKRHMKLGNGQIALPILPSNLTHFWKANPQTLAKVVEEDLQNDWKGAWVEIEVACGDVDRWVIVGARQPKSEVKGVEKAWDQLRACHQEGKREFSFDYNPYSCLLPSTLHQRLKERLANHLPGWDLDVSFENTHFQIKFWPKLEPFIECLWKMICDERKKGANIFTLEQDALPPPGFAVVGTIESTLGQRLRDEFPKYSGCQVWVENGKKFVVSVWIARETPPLTFDQIWRQLILPVESGSGKVSCTIPRYGWTPQGLKKELVKMLELLKLPGEVKVEVVEKSQLRAEIEYDDSGEKMAIQLIYQRIIENNQSVKGQQAYDKIPGVSAERLQAILEDKLKVFKKHSGCRVCEEGGRYVVEAWIALPDPPTFSEPHLPRVTCSNNLAKEISSRLKESEDVGFKVRVCPPLQGTALSSVRVALEDELKKTWPKVGVRLIIEKTGVTDVWVVAAWREEEGPRIRAWLGGGPRKVEELSAEQVEEWVRDILARGDGRWQMKVPARGWTHEGLHLAVDLELKKHTPRRAFSVQEEKDGHFIVEIRVEGGTTSLPGPSLPRATCCNDLLTEIKEKLDRHSTVIMFVKILPPLHEGSLSKFDSAKAHIQEKLRAKWPGAEVKISALPEDPTVWKVEAERGGGRHSETFPTIQGWIKDVILKRPAGVKCKINIPSADGWTQITLHQAVVEELKNKYAEFGPVEVAVHTENQHYFCLELGRPDRISFEALEAWIKQIYQKDGQNFKGQLKIPSFGWTQEILKKAVSQERDKYWHVGAAVVSEEKDGYFLVTIGEEWEERISPQKICERINKILDQNSDYLDARLAIPSKGWGQPFFLWEQLDPVVKKQWPEGKCKVEWGTGGNPSVFEVTVWKQFASKKRHSDETEIAEMEKKFKEMEMEETKKDKERMALIEKADKVVMVINAEVDKKFKILDRFTFNILWEDAPCGTYIEKEVSKYIQTRWPLGRCKGEGMGLVLELVCEKGPKIFVGTKSTT